jgi:hypothetical protein
MSQRQRHPALLPQEGVIPFLLGGRATVTIKNRDTGRRATYRVEARQDGSFDVLAFTGQDNASRSHYSLLGRIDAEGAFVARTPGDVVSDLTERVRTSPRGHWVDGQPGFLAKCAALLGAGHVLTKGMAYRFRGALSKYRVPGWVEDPLRQTVFPWTFARLQAGKALPASIEIWHEGGCQCCGKRLTVPASIELGMGPDCAEERGRLGEWRSLNERLGSDLDAYLRTSGRIPSA